MWIKKAFRDYYKPKLRRSLKHDPTQDEMDRRFEEIYSQTNSILLVGINEGVSIQFYEIARFTKAEVDGFRDNPEEYLFNRFGGGWFELGVAEWCDGKGNKTGALNAFEKARNDRAWRKMAEYEIDKVKNPQKYEN